MAETYTYHVVRHWTIRDAGWTYTLFTMGYDPDHGTGGRSTSRSEINPSREWAQRMAAKYGVEIEEEGNDFMSQSPGHLEHTYRFFRDGDVYACEVTYHWRKSEPSTERVWWTGDRVWAETNAGHYGVEVEENKNP